MTIEVLRHQHGMLPGIQQLLHFHLSGYPRCLHVIVALPLADLHNPNAAPKTVVMGKLSLLRYPTAPFASKLTPDASSCATD